MKQSMSIVLSVIAAAGLVAAARYYLLIHTMPRESSIADSQVEKLQQESSAQNPVDAAEYGGENYTPPTESSNSTPPALRLRTNDAWRDISLDGAPMLNCEFVENCMNPAKEIAVWDVGGYPILMGNEAMDDVVRSGPHSPNGESTLVTYDGRYRSRYAIVDGSGEIVCRPPDMVGLGDERYDSLFWLWASKNLLVGYFFHDKNIGTEENQSIDVDKTIVVVIDVNKPDALSVLSIPSASKGRVVRLDGVTGEGQLVLVDALRVNFSANSKHGNHYTPHAGDVMLGKFKIGKYR